MTNEAAARVLFLDTSGETGTVVLAVDGALGVVRKLERSRDYAVVLNDVVADVLKEGGVTMRNLTAVCVMAGPGSYTGLRIALAAAKGWCYALEIPLFLENGLHLLAEEARTARPHGATYIAILPARQNEYFFAAYNAAGVALVEPRHLALPDAPGILDSLSGRFVVVGNATAAAEIFATGMFAGEHPEILMQERVSEQVWLEVALEQIESGRMADLAYAEPFYLKPAHTTTPKALR